MGAFIKAALLSGVRSRVFYGLLILSVLILGSAWLAANFSVRHPETLALDIGLSGIRLVVILMALFWVQELFAKDIELKTVMFVLSYPVPRSIYLLGRFFGITLLSGAAIAIMGIIVLLLVIFGPIDYPGATPVNLGVPYLCTLLYLWLSIMTVSAFALMIATLSTVPMLPLLLGGGFAIVASSIGPTVDYLLLAETADYEHRQILGPVLDKVLWLLPDLSRLDIRDWALYGARPDTDVLVAGLIMPVGYIMILLAIAINRFDARDFT